MEAVSERHEAAMLRESARQIRKHVEEVETSVERAKTWLLVAELKEIRALRLEASALEAELVPRGRRKVG